MIVAAALPLVAEYGAAVTTAQIARAAGIGEATIFRAFKDKEEVLAACTAEAMNPSHVLRELASISLDQPLADRLTEAAEAMRAHLTRMGAVAGALHASGHRRERTPAARPTGGRPTGARPIGGRTSDNAHDGPDRPADSRETSMRATRDALTELVEPDRQALRLPPERVASVFLGMLFTQLHFGAEGADVDPVEFVDVLLHGTLNQPGSGT
ncbi:putative transcriptional regulator, TetR family protein [Streptomyces bingchenggensis BCW-1]|uniref:Putative transcriptional regulator, TetR family protein n=2 Tax=Streptomyces TaxID=1883 RepID=D7BVF3_STRBB|nr:putative transcriptional regulator, TetR family protein [Streptomyces bingchenggensis BCW-1]